MFRQRKKNYKQPNRLPLRKLRMLQQEIDLRLQRYAQLTLAKHMYTVYKQMLAENDSAGNLKCFHY